TSARPDAGLGGFLQAADHGQGVDLRIYEETMKRGRDPRLVARETELRDKLSTPRAAAPDANEVKFRECYSRILRKKLEELELAYSKDWNPVRVWAALFW